MSTPFSFEEGQFEFNPEFEPEEDLDFNIDNLDSALADSECKDRIRQRSPFVARSPVFARNRAGYEPAFGAHPQRGAEFVRWVQNSLNQVMGIRMPVTGVMGAATRRALRRFQQQNRLGLNRIAGPATVRALIAAKKTRTARTSLTAAAQHSELDFLEFETEAGLKTKLKFLSLLPHMAEVNGKDVALTPGIMDPGIYDGLEKYKVSMNDVLQKCLMQVMKQPAFRQIRVSLVDLTTGVPQFAGFNHKDQVFVASVSKIAAMLGAFQLRHDLQVSLKQKKPTPKKLTELFDLMRDDWAGTQFDPGGKASPFSSGITLRGRLVFVNGRPVPLTEPKAPRLNDIFKDVAAGKPIAIEFKSTGESFGQLETIKDSYNKARHQFDWAEKRLQAAQKQGDAKSVADATKALNYARFKLHPEEQKMNALGFKERMGLMVGGDVPSSNFATFTVVRDLGHLYIASTLIQSGLYDSNRKGGLWLGADYARGAWSTPLAGLQSSTAGSLAAFMTLLVKKRLVSNAASDEMQSLMHKLPLRNPGTGSWFGNSLNKLKPSGLKTVLAKVGLAGGGADDLAYIERDVDLGGGKNKRLCYVAVGLRASRGTDLERLILDLDKCILANNGLTSAQGGHGH